jgi:hypothetical protein
MEKGKLCKNDERDKSSDNNSSNNIFDDDFMRGDFGFGTNENESKKDNGNQVSETEKKIDGDEEDNKDDENDH